MERILKRNAVPNPSECKWFICLFLVALCFVPKLSWSAQPTIRIAQAVDALAFLPLYVSRANGYFNDEGITKSGESTCKRSRAPLV